MKLKVEIESRETEIDHMRELPLEYHYVLANLGGR